MVPRFQLVFMSAINIRNKDTLDYFDNSKWSKKKKEKWLTLKLVFLPSVWILCILKEFPQASRHYVFYSMYPLPHVSLSSFHPYLLRWLPYILNKNMYSLSFHCIAPNIMKTSQRGHLLPINQKAIAKTAEILLKKVWSKRRSKIR